MWIREKSLLKWDEEYFCFYGLEKPVQNIVQKMFRFIFSWAADGEYIEVWRTNKNERSVDWSG